MRRLSIGHTNYHVNVPSKLPTNKQTLNLLPKSLMTDRNESCLQMFIFTCALQHRSLQFEFVRKSACLRRQQYCFAADRCSSVKVLTVNLCSHDVLVCAVSHANAQNMLTNRNTQVSCQVLLFLWRRSFRNHHLYIIELFLKQNCEKQASNQVKM